MSNPEVIGIHCLAYKSLIASLQLMVVTPISFENSITIYLNPVA